MKNERTTKIRIAHSPLTRREQLHGLYAGASGLPWETYEQKIRTATLDAPSGGTVKGGGAAGARAPIERAEVVAAEALEIAGKRRELDAAAPDAKARQEAALDALAKVEAQRPSDVKAWLWTLFAGALLLGDGAFTFQSLAGAFGWDLTSGDTPIFTIILTAIASLVAVLANAWAGIRATDDHSPLRRLGGWVMLLGCGLVLAVLRGAAASDASFALTLFGFLIPIIAGFAAGVAHHKLSAYLGERQAFRAELAAREQEASSAGDRLAQIDQGLTQTAERRRLLAAEAESLVTEGERRHAEGAAREQEGSRLLDARLASARHAYDLGATFAGRKRPGKPSGGRHA